MQHRFLLQILLLAQHVSGITMPIIRSSRVLYSGCCVWYFVLWFFPHINEDARSKSHQTLPKVCPFLLGHPVYNYADYAKCRAFVSAVMNLRVP